MSKVTLAPDPYASWKRARIDPWLLRSATWFGLCVVALAGCGSRASVDGDSTAPSMETTTVTVTNPYSPSSPPPPVYLNVKDYGARGDWSTDDTAAIQAALNDAPDSGAVVYFPPGGYDVPNGGLYSNKTVTLLGVKGLDGTGSRINIGADGVVGLQLDGPSSVIDSLEVTREEPTSSTNLIGVVMNNNFARIVSARISGFGINLKISGTYYTVVDTSFRNFFHAGVEINNVVDHGDAGDGTVTASTFERNAEAPVGGSALHWVSGGGLRFVNNKINGEHSLENGLLFEPAAGVETSIAIVADNSIENYHGQGVVLRGGDGVISHSLIVSDNEFASYSEESRSVGVRIDQDISGATISGNSIHWNDYGIIVDRGRNIAITGNALTQIQQDGVVIGPDTVAVTVPDQVIEVLDGKDVVRR